MVGIGELVGIVGMVLALVGVGIIGMEIIGVTTMVILLIGVIITDIMPTGMVEQEEIITTITTEVEVEILILLEEIV